ncbi:VirB4 family type IV secretion system protein [Vallitalea guaymasensis]|uniref:VirB4 family type IV secretion system protein n=1 Tax=Vallitalea guaymasensis TaxID=1185412 RepID=UPI000DE27C86|nr:hypothetical protein [Vallitalea guaymasensis]
MFKFLKNVKSKKTKDIKIKNQSKKEESSIFSGGTIKNLVAPNGVNPNPLGHMIIHDNGQDVYIRNFYIDKLPRRATFARTFNEMFQFSNSTISVFINPLIEGKASKEMDNNVMSLESEQDIAMDKKDRNRLRRVSKKLSEAEQWCEVIETGENKLFNVGFLITVFAKDLEELNVKSGDLFSLARSKDIDISATYAYHPEAFLSNLPINRTYSVGINKLKQDLIKFHVMDKFSLSTIFSHINYNFSHKNGVVIGRNLFTGRIIPFDIYDKSHNGYGCLIAGATGAGKSTFVKTAISRNIKFGCRAVSLDTESKGSRGEYTRLTKKVNGVNYRICKDSDEIINIFEVDVNEEFDEDLQREYPVLKVIDKIRDVKHIILTMIRKENLGKPTFEVTTSLERIVTDIVSELYEEKGILDGEIDSLYKLDKSIFVNGKITNGKVKKELPILSDFYYKILQYKKQNRNSHHDIAINIIVDAMKDYVRELNVCEECLKRYSNEQYDELQEKEGKKICSCGHHVDKIKGNLPYYDGQSTVKIDYYTPMVNIDVSQLHEKDKPIAQTIALNFINENFIKKNSMNPAKAEKLIVLFDETHKILPFDEAREFLINVYRTARKRLVSPWTATQSLADYGAYGENCLAIIKNTVSKFILRHDHTDRELLKKATKLTDSQIDIVMSLDIGQVCLIDKNEVVYIKVDTLQIEKEIYETDISKIKKGYETDRAS